jgi:hypothetical protein
MGADEVVISRVLNHAAKGVTSRHYNHATRADGMKIALDQWNERLQRIVVEHFKDDQNDLLITSLDKANINQLITNKYLKIFLTAPTGEYSCSGHAATA